MENVNVFLFKKNKYKRQFQNYFLWTAIELFITKTACVLKKIFLQKNFINCLMFIFSKNV